MLLRLDLEAWHYYIAGGLYVTFAFALYAFDTSVADRCKAAIAAAAQARRLCEQAAAKSGAEIPMR